MKLPGRTMPVTAVPRARLLEATIDCSSRQSHAALVVAASSTPFGRWLQVEGTCSFCWC